MNPVSRLVCAGCGAGPDPTDPYPFVCPNAARDDDVDHVLHRVLDLAATAFPQSAEPNPFLRYRRLLHPYQLGLRHGLSDGEFCTLVATLDAAVAALDGHGFTATPFARSPGLSDSLGFASQGGVWVKD